MDSTSIGLNFHTLVGSLILPSKRLTCSSALTENQYFKRMMPDPINILSKSGAVCKNSIYSLSLQKPMTFSTPARLYQLRSKRTISPAAGKFATYR